MQAPFRILVYAIAIWLVWISLVVGATQLLPPTISGAPLFVSLQMVALAALVLGCSVLYLRKVGQSSFGEGIVVGVVWVIVMIAIDVAHAVVMPAMVPDIGAYLAAVAPSYVIMPIITTLTLGSLERKSFTPGA